MITIKRIILLLAVIQCLLTGCSKEDGSQIQFQQVGLSPTKTSEIVIDPESELSVLAIREDDDHLLLFQRSQPFFSESQTSNVFLHEVDSALAPVSTVVIDNVGIVWANQYLPDTQRIAIFSFGSYDDLYAGDLSFSCYTLNGEYCWSIPLNSTSHISPIVEYGNMYFFVVTTLEGESSQVFCVEAKSGTITNSFLIPKSENKDWLTLLNVSEKKIVIDTPLEEGYHKIEVLGWDGESLQSSNYKLNCSNPLFFFRTDGAEKYYVSGKGDYIEEENIYSEGYAIYSANSDGDLTEVTSLNLPTLEGCVARLIGTQDITNKHYIFGTYNSKEKEADSAVFYPSEMQFVVELNKDFSVKQSWIYPSVDNKWTVGIGKSRNDSVEVITTQIVPETVQISINTLQAQNEGAIKKH